MKNNSKKLKIFFSLLIFLLILLIALTALSVWLIAGKLSPNKTQILKKIPFPLAIVSGQPILSNVFFSNVEALAPAMKETGQTEILKKLYEASINQEINRQLAKQAGVFPNEKQINYEFQAAVQSKEQEKYPLDEKTYKNLILKPNLTLINLRVWFNGQKKLNPTAYGTADLILNKIKQGEKLENLALLYSQDQQDKFLEGDAGFIESNGILPEILEKLDEMALGDIKAIASRRGLHIILLAGNDNNGPSSGERMRLKQIFIQTTGFEEWIQMETKKLKIIKVIDF